MEVRGERLAPLAKRVKETTNLGNTIYSYIKEERVKAYLPFKHQFVGDLLTERKIREWKAGGYFIASQTGTGKSTLIRDVIVPVATDRGARVLLIVPRVALAMQYKRELASMYCPQALEELRDPGINKRSYWGPVDVYTLQSLSNEGKREEILKKSLNYDFVLLDEVQAYTVDATFNPLTEEIFKFLICQVGRHCKRVYLTGTPDIILEEVAGAEAEVLGRPLPERDWKGDFKDEVYLTLFQFQLDYEYLAPCFFEKDETLFQCLSEIPENEKAIIFVHSKSQGLKLQDKLGGRERALYLDASNKASTEEEAFSELITENSFKHKFLITTRFLDVGVNLIDEKIKTVVVFQRHPEDVIQMLGRKRVKPNETVKLYLQVPKYKGILKELEELKRNYKTMRAAQVQFNSKLGNWISEIPMPLFLYGKNNERYVGYNNFTYRIIQYHITQLETYVNGHNEERDFYNNFVHTVLNWFPGHKEAIDLERKKEVLFEEKKELEALLETYLDKELNEEETLELSNQIVQILKIPRRLDQAHSIALNKIKEMFKIYGIQYGVYNQSRKNKKGIWLVQKGAWE